MWPITYTFEPLNCSIKGLLGPVSKVIKEKKKKGRCKATWKSEYKLPWREAGSLNYHDDKVDSDQ